jgi:hypothetical protein
MLLANRAPTMPETIESNSILPAGNVGEVRPETNWERVARVMLLYTRHIAAMIILVAAMWVLIAILFSENPKLAEYRSGAWGLLSAMAGGVMAHFFGERWRSGDVG